MVVHNVLFEDRGATLMSTVQLLPASSDLDIGGEFFEMVDAQAEASRGRGLPRYAELAALRSRSLTRLRLWMLDGPETGNTLRLSGLPALRSCEMVSGPDTVLHIRCDAAGFREVPQLRSLEISNDEALELQSRSLARLTALTSLTLQGCGLRSVPADMAALSGTLCELDLSCNDPMQVDEAAVAGFVQCGQLSCLRLSKADILFRWRSKLARNEWQPVERLMDEEGYRPARWSEKASGCWCSCHLRSAHGAAMTSLLSFEFAAGVLARHDDSGRRL